MSTATNDKRKLASANDRAVILAAVNETPGLVISELAAIAGVTYFRARALLALMLVEDKVYSRRLAVNPGAQPPSFAAHIYPGIAPERNPVFKRRTPQRDPLVAALFGPGPAASC